MVPRVARSGSSSTLFGKTKSNEGEKPSGRRKGMVSCPPIPRPISDKRDKREKKRIFPKVYIFRFFRASRRSRPSPSFLLILSKKFMKEIPGNITFLSQITMREIVRRILFSNSNFVFIEKSIFRLCWGGLPPPLDS